MELTIWVEQRGSGETPASNEVGILIRPDGKKDCDRGICCGLIDAW
jgi:hypothetical protein